MWLPEPIASVATSFTAFDVQVNLIQIQTTRILTSRYSPISSRLRKGLRNTPLAQWSRHGRLKDGPAAPSPTAPRLVPSNRLESRSSLR